MRRIESYLSYRIFYIIKKHIANWAHQHEGITQGRPSLQLLMWGATKTSPQRVPAVESLAVLFRSITWTITLVLAPRRPLLVYPAEMVEFESYEHHWPIDGYTRKQTGFRWCS